MTITLPKGWGPATVLVVLYALAAAVGGAVEVIQGDLDYTGYMESMKYAVAGVGALAIGRGAAYIGGDPSFAKTDDADNGGNTVEGGVGK